MDMRSRSRLIDCLVGCVALLFLSAGPLSAEDGSSLYKQLCSSCHDSAFNRAPDRQALRTMSPERVLAALESGVMLSMASNRTGVERRALAEFVTDKSFGQAPSTKPSPQTMCRATEGGFADPLAGPRWNGWGRVFVGTQNGTVYSLNAATGCVHWFFQAAAAVRAAISIGRIETNSGPRYAAFIGDRAANIYSVDAATGELLWKTRADDFPFARVTGAPVFYNGRLYFGIASGEETAGAAPDYECCRFRGSLVALNAATGQQIWKTYTIADEARPTKKNKNGTQLWGPSGVPIWTSPAIDVARNAVYATTGNNYSDPPTGNSDSFMAFDLDSGKILWARQVTVADAWNTSCRLEDKINCADSDGPDFDFASPPILVTLASGRRALVAGQKSGVVHAVDPDRQGEILWQQRVGKGGINGGVQWGSAADQSNVYVALSDIGRFVVPNSQATVPDPETGGGMFALRLDSGQRLWYTAPPRCGARERCSPAQSAAVSAIPGVAFSGSVDGHLRGYSAANGAIVWDFDTVRSYETVNGVPARGGSLNVGGPAIAGGMIFVNSGYVQNGMPGNVLIGFSVDGK
jgi:polyvinyl alcohol dehydrogenase (cytochrome)